MNTKIDVLFLGPPKQLSVIWIRAIT